jgi:hypothetical protein
LLREGQGGKFESIENRARLLRAIADVEPQTASQGSGARLDADSRGRIAVTIGRQTVHIFPDTGANLSVLPRGLARRLGLRIRPANFTIASSLGGRVHGDVTVADLSFSNGTRVRNAIFLVLPDGAVPTALLGFPVLSGVGGIDHSGVAVALGRPIKADGKGARLAVSGSDLLLKARFAGEDILCRLDSGSSRSVFYAPFYRRFAGRLSVSTRRPVRAGGATGTHRLGARQISSLTIAVGGRNFRLSPATVLTEPVRGVPNQALACNIGWDLLRSAGGYRIDLVNMTVAFGR